MARGAQRKAEGTGTHECITGKSSGMYIKSQHLDVKDETKKEGRRRNQRHITGIFKEEQREKLIINKDLSAHTYNTMPINLKIQGKFILLGRYKSN